MERSREAARTLDELMRRTNTVHALRMGVVTELAGGMAKVRLTDAASAGDEWYATLAGFALELGDVVALAPMDATFLVLGRVQTSGPIRAILPGQVLRVGGTPAIAAAPALGSGGSLGATVSGTDSTGIVVLTAGSSGTSTGVVATVSFATAMPTANYSVQLQPYSNAARSIATHVSPGSRSTGSWTIQTNTAFTTNGVYQYLYTIDGY